MKGQTTIPLGKIPYNLPEVFPVNEMTAKEESKLQKLPNEFSCIWRMHANSKWKLFNVNDRVGLVQIPFPFGMFDGLKLVLGLYSFHRFYDGLYYANETVNFVNTF